MAAKPSERQNYHVPGRRLPGAASAVIRARDGRGADTMRLVNTARTSRSVWSLRLSGALRRVRRIGGWKHLCRLRGHHHVGKRGGHRRQQRSDLHRHPIDHGRYTRRHRPVDADGRRSGAMRRWPTPSTGRCGRRPRAARSVKRDAGNDGTWSFDTKPEILRQRGQHRELIRGLDTSRPSAHPTSYVRPC